MAAMVLHLAQQRARCRHSANHYRAIPTMSPWVTTLFATVHGNLGTCAEQNAAVIDKLRNSACRRLGIRARTGRSRSGRAPARYRACHDLAQRQQPRRGGEALCSAAIRVPTMPRTWPKFACRPLLLHLKPSPLAGEGTSQRSLPRIRRQQAASCRPRMRKPPERSPQAATAHPDPPSARPARREKAEATPSEVDSMQPTS